MRPCLSIDKFSCPSDRSLHTETNVTPARVEEIGDAVALFFVRSHWEDGIWIRAVSCSWTFCTLASSLSLSLSEQTSLSFLYFPPPSPPPPLYPHRIRKIPMHHSSFCLPTRWNCSKTGRHAARCSRLWQKTGCFALSLPQALWVLPPYSACCWATDQDIYGEGDNRKMRKSESKSKGRRKRKEKVCLCINVKT